MINTDVDELPRAGQSSTEEDPCVWWSRPTEGTCWHPSCMPTALWGPPVAGIHGCASPYEEGFFVLQQYLHKDKLYCYRTLMEEFGVIQKRWIKRKETIPWPWNPADWVCISPQPDHSCIASISMSFFGEGGGSKGGGICSASTDVTPLSTAVALLYLKKT